ncbi:hypothetical protein DAEQUDRAFT_231319 [Daedalea quercina L-15889]|uniref:Uncharacterized protein n=1 Tax=Daedalea quercina L-15889 TaxID=1314783 RepID=A0A165QTT0_9APHY|nr:hypothetical protein DAEQUDRAFT_231319 [Daedalea quercina L-15889]
MFRCHRRALDAAHPCSRWQRTALRKRGVRPVMLRPNRNDRPDLLACPQWPLRRSSQSHVTPCLGNGPKHICVPWLCSILRLDRCRRFFLFGMVSCGVDVNFAAKLDVLHLVPTSGAARAGRLAFHVGSRHMWRLDLWPSRKCARHLPCRERGYSSAPSRRKIGLWAHFEWLNSPHSHGVRPYARCGTPHARDEGGWMLPRTGQHYPGLLDGATAMRC